MPLKIYVSVEPHYWLSSLQLSKYYARGRPNRAEQMSRDGGDQTWIYRHTYEHIYSKDILYMYVLIMNWVALEEKSHRHKPKKNLMKDPKR